LQRYRRHRYPVRKPGGAVTGLIPEKTSRDSVHVLIIAIGRYDEARFKTLPGAIISAERLAEYWRSSNPAGGRELGSIEILASGDKPLDMQIHDGSTQSVEPATHQGVKDALNAWAVRCASGALGVLHWIGHGETLTKTDEANAPRDPNYALYTGGLLSFVGRQAQSAFDWFKILSGLQRAIPVPVLCFIDACSRHDPAKSRDYPSPWDFEDGPLLSRADVYFSVNPGEKAHCAREDQELCEEGFNGGAVFSEAIRLALSRYGSDDRDSREGYAVIPELLRTATTKRLDRWRRRSRELKDLGSVFVAQQALTGPIVRMSEPFGMLEVSSAASGTRNIDCHVTDPAGLSRKLPDAVQFWDADLAHGKDYGVRLERAPGWARDAMHIAESKFDINAPHRHVKVG
jgi:hypothetical protein